MTIKISPRQITKVLSLVIIALTLIHCLFQYLEYGLGLTQVSHIRTIFDFEYDGNLTTWYSSVTLLICSLLLSLIASAKQQNQDSYIRHWQILAIIFAVMSLDEVAMLHERAGNLIEKLSPVEFNGWLNFQWVLLGVPLTVIIAIAYLKFMAHLPAKTRNLFLLAGGLFIGGALGLEILAGHQESLGAANRFFYELFTSIEELWEKLGVLVFIYALLNYMEKYLNQIKILVGVESQKPVPQGDNKVRSKK
jgi:hypothetical protein